MALVNTIVGVLAGDAVTANGSANGGLTIGNGYVSGIFGASVMTGGSFRGGNIQSSANLVITSNVYVQGETIYVGNSTVNASMNGTNLVIQTGAFTNATIGFLAQSNLAFANTTLSDIELINTPAGSVVVDAYPLSAGRTSEYLIQAVDNAANNFQAQKLLVTHDGFNAYAAQYALLLSNGVVASFSASVNSTSLILTATTSSSNATIRAARTNLVP